MARTQGCRSLVAMLTVVGLAAGCSGGDDDSATAGASTSDAVESTEDNDTDAPTSTSATATTSGENNTTSPTTDASVPDTSVPDTSVPDTSVPDASVPATTPPAEPKPLLDGFDDIIHTEVQAGAVADRPLLSWSAVDGADHYGVYVYAPSGQIYWAWQGRATSVELGGGIGDAEGPSASPGMTWAVIAYDAALIPISVSNRTLL